MSAFDATLATLAQALGPGVTLRAVAQTGSTNSDLLEACRLEARPQLLVAERQTAGRGRLGRSWQAQPGESLTFSLAWPCRGWDLQGLSLAVGLSLVEALDPRGQALQLKWPNDLWLARRKLGGILLETVSSGGTPGAVVVGVGLNVVAPSLDIPTAGLRELDARWTAPLALAAVVPPLVECLARWRGFEPSLRAAYARRDGLHGHTIRIGAQQGVAEGISPQGLLNWRDAQGTVQTLNAGEVRLQWEGVA